MKKKDIKKEILEQADIEALNLKTHAKKKELSLLDFEKLDPESKSSCIYGLMTGNCNSKRAKSLILKCAKKVLVKPDTTKSFRNSMNDYVLNGKPKRKREDEMEYVSPIETVIFRYPEYNKKLIKFLKGERDYFYKKTQQ